MAPDSKENGKCRSISLRRATVEDYKAVMDILPNVSEVKNYLPFQYYTFFQSNKHAAYLVEDNGVVVSFVIVELSQENSVATMMAVRTRRSHQGQGLSVSKNKALRSLILAEHPTIKTEALTMKIHNGNDNLRSQMETVFTVKIDSFTTEVEDAKEHLKRYKMDGKHHELSYLNSLKILNETSAFEDFLRQFTSEYITADVNGRLVHVNKTDLKQLFATNRTYVTLADAVKNGLILRDSVKFDKFVAFSFSKITLAGKSVDCEMRYFGDLANLSDHVAVHLEYACATICDVEKINFYFRFPVSLDFEEVRENISQLGLTKDKAIDCVSKAVIGTAIKDFRV